MKPMLKALGTKPLKLKYDKPLSNFAFKFNLRRYTSALSVHYHLLDANGNPQVTTVVGWCRL